MEKINMDGKITIKTKIENPLSTVVEILQEKHKDAFNEVHPMVQLIYKTLNDVKSWNTIEE